MTPAEAVSWFCALPPSSVRLGLERVQAALAALEQPQTRYPALHVAGTNGKGSTCAFAASCLAAQGYKVGLYTSPHLLRVNERIQINGVAISDELLGQRLLEVLAAVNPDHGLTFFEVGTVVALWHLAQEKVDLAVLETGLGGRLDAVTCARPSVTAITPVSFDHMDYLGDTVQAIAAEKAGILKPGVPVVLSAQTPEVLAVLEAAATRVGALVRLEGRDFRLEPEPAQPGGFVYRGMRSSIPALTLGLKGPHQAQNAAVALACLELLEDRGIQVSKDNVRQGLATATWPGRLEELPGNLLLDGAHNPAGAQALARALDAVYPGRPIHLLFGVLADKDHGPMLRTLFPKCAAVYLTPVGSPRTLEPARYLEEARALCPKVEAFGSVPEALAAARQGAGAEGLVVCAGSLFLIGQLKAALG